ncbi:hypothetical protein [Wenyingzhuangia aestuarii]|uniref:hypothetical protein n=1 Tax=Wenyingzhuangia aestuarii TaxID=1647582 RepID=UPI0014388F00|nr:hypothetical protein [Wenyingzhuangia aestuarii]NJB82393.1 DNA uptake protein ComE-like DNA-binding protein [Wenyingzhuangia aestuarii]
MKKLVFIFALFLALAVNAQEKKSYKGALEHAGLTPIEMTKAMEIQKEKVAAFKELKSSDLDAEAQKAKKKEINKAANKKLRTLIGPEKTKAIQQYWKKK